MQDKGSFANSGISKFNVSFKIKVTVGDMIKYKLRELGLKKLRYRNFKANNN